MNRSMLLSAACILLAVVALLGVRASASVALSTAPTQGLSQDFMLVPDMSGEVASVAVASSSSEVLEDWEFTLRDREPKCRFNR